MVGLDQDLQESKGNDMGRIPRALHGQVFSQHLLDMPRLGSFYS